MTVSRPGDRGLAVDLGDLVDSRRNADLPLVVGITGMDTSGKSRLALALAGNLRSRGLPCVLVHVDDFHRPRSERYLPGVPEPVQYYDHSVDFGRLARQVLVPLRRDGRLDARLRLLDLRADTWTLDREYVVPPGGIVLVEGVFLFRAETREHLDLAIYLHIDERAMLERAELRDVPGQGPGVIRKYHHKYLPAQRAYLAAHPPQDHADVIVDNTLWDAPVVTRWPATTVEPTR
jgi:uridine kinase